MCFHLPFWCLCYKHWMPWPTTCYKKDDRLVEQWEPHTCYVEQSYPWIQLLLTNQTTHRLVSELARSSKLPNKSNSTNWSLAISQTVEHKTINTCFKPLTIGFGILSWSIFTEKVNQYIQFTVNSRFMNICKSVIFCVIVWLHHCLHILICHWISLILT